MIIAVVHRLLLFVKGTMYQKAPESLFHYKRESLLIGVILVKPDFLKATTKAMNVKTFETRMAAFQIIPDSNVNFRFHIKVNTRGGQVLINTKKIYSQIYQ